MLFILCKCFDSVAINFSWSNQPWSIFKRKLIKMRLHKPLLTCSVFHSTFSINYRNLFLIVFFLKNRQNVNAISVCGNGIYFLSLCFIKCLQIPTSGQGCWRIIESLSLDGSPIKATDPVCPVI